MRLNGDDPGDSIQLPFKSQAGLIPMEKINKELREFGLLILGGFVPKTGVDLLEMESGEPAKSVYLVGNAGSQMWKHFSKHLKEFASSDPLDHWIESVLGGMAAKNEMDVLFPFKGPPYHPFQQWALKAGGFSQSPLGVLVHPIYGPWFAFRGAFLSTSELELSENLIAEGPCESCVEKPCLTACPVNAISDETGYDVSACRNHLKSGPKVPCMTGCIARCVCPVGKEFRYEKNHARFHMEAFSPSS